jgi:Na+-transporting methylmalonyl-CoA/oxaloacetate decarboxylase gamma subunit
MENQIPWAEVVRIMATGFGAVFAIMVMLAVITWGVGKIVQKLEKPKAEDGNAS